METCGRYACTLRQPSCGILDALPFWSNMRKTAAFLLGLSLTILVTAVGEAFHIRLRCPTASPYPGAGGAGLRLHGRHMFHCGIYSRGRNCFRLQQKGAACTMAEEIYSRWDRDRPLRLGRSGCVVHSRHVRSASATAPQDAGLYSLRDLRTNGARG